MNARLDYIGRLLLSSVPLGLIAWFATEFLSLSSLYFQLLAVFCMMTLWEVLVDETYLADWRNEPVKSRSS